MSKLFPKGVTIIKSGKFKATISVAGKLIHLGYFERMEDAAEEFGRAKRFYQQSRTGRKKNAGTKRVDVEKHDGHERL